MLCFTVLWFQSNLYLGWVFGEIVHATREYHGRVLSARLVSFFIFIFIEIVLIYNVVLISDYSSDSVTYIFFFRLFYVIDYHKILRRIPCAVQ